MTSFDTDQCSYFVLFYYFQQFIDTANFDNFIRIAFDDSIQAVYLSIGIRIWINLFTIAPDGEKLYIQTAFFVIILFAMCLPGQICI